MVHIASDLRAQLQSSLGSAYTLERELGGGGMSRVFVAEEAALGRKVVVKVLPPELAAGLSVERFRREILLAAALSHPHIVPIHATGEMATGAGEGGERLPYYTMPYVAGESLRARLSRGGALPLAEAVGILRDVAKALAYAHEQGIVHRDIKPENVLLAGGSAMVTDFGIAKAISASAGGGDASGGATLTQLGTSLGTPAYMAPEQALGDSVDHRTDLYAWGVVAFEMVAGAHPFAGKSTAQQLVAAHIAEVPPALGHARPDAPPALAALVARCLAKAPVERPATAREMLDALDAVPLTPGAGIVLPARRSSRRRVARVAGAGVALAVLAAAGWTFTVRARGATAEGIASAPNERTIRSLAVLPLEIVGGDTTQAYFAEGLAEELATALARGTGLRGASRTSVLALARRGDLDVREIGRRLDVGAVLEGTVRRAGSRLRVTAQLTSVADGLTLWGETYERDVADVFAVQDDIAQSIVSALRLRIAGGGGAGLTVSGTRDLEAHELYLRARHLWNTRANLPQAAALLRQAIARDSGYAQAHAALASVYSVLSDWSDARADTSDARAFSAAQRALALDPRLAEPHAVLGNIYSQRGRVAEAEREYRLAIAADPGLGTAYQWLANLLAAEGHVDQAVPEYARAHAIDPLAPNIQGMFGVALMSAERFAEAERQLRDVLTLEGSYLAAYSHLSRIAAVTGQLDRALVLADSGIAVTAGVPTPAPMRAQLLAARGYVLARAGRAPEARRVLAEVRRLGGASDDPARAPAYLEAVLYAGLGESDSALDALGRVFSGARDMNVTLAMLDPALRDVRRDARFVTMVRARGYGTGQP